MQIHTLELPKHWEQVVLYPVSDMHTGDILFARKEFEAFSDMILREPNRFIMVNGDIMNNNLRDSKGSPYEDIMSPNDQVKEVIRLLLPLKDRIVGMNNGNHEDRTKDKAGVDITEYMAELLGVPFNEDENLFKIKVGERTKNKQFVYTVYITHGRCGGKRPGAILNAVEDLSKNVLADVYVMGHAHRRMAHVAEFREPDLRNNKITMRKQLYVVGAGWLYYGGYPVRHMMRPQVRGAHPIILSGTEKNVSTII